MADKRHKEMKVLLTAISKHLSDNNDSDTLIQAIKNMPKNEPPIINIEQEKIVLSLEQMHSDIIASNNKVIELLSNRLMPSSFELVKNFGVTQSVKVTYKKSNDIN
jgi:hypothetical protein